MADARRTCSLRCSGHALRVMGECGAAVYNAGIMMTIGVSMLPALLRPADLVGKTAVVIDVLRASTTIVHALEQGARSVVPCLNVEDARTIAATLPQATCLLGGERHGALIEGFDLDNSPRAYTHQVVCDKTVVFTTTNGTRALLECASARTILMGAFVNLDALRAAIQELRKPVHLVCAGTDGQLTAEDILFAGALTESLMGGAGANFQPADIQAQMAVDFYQAHAVDARTLRETFFESLGARNLLALGMQEDIEFCLQRSVLSCVPVWNSERRQLVRWNPTNS